MKRYTYTNPQGKAITLGAAVQRGGEAEVFRVAHDPSSVAKIYHKITGNHQAKLEHMIGNPPADPTLKQGHISIAWPVDILFGNNQFAGFLMPYIKGTRHLMDVYHPGTRRKVCPLFNWMYLHYAAANLSSAVAALHAKGYCIGDINERNILVKDNAMVTLIDTDSFQVFSSAGAFRCLVGAPEFTPPELMGRSFADVDRSVETDNFSLAVLIFKLLMEGVHPFDGLYPGTGNPPLLEERISRGDYPHSGSPCRITPRPNALALDVLHAEVRQMFHQCFDEGHRLPSQRPNAARWKEALEMAAHELAVCQVNRQHYYGNHLQNCPWCERRARFGNHCRHDPFPSESDVRAGRHLITPPTKVASHRVTPQTVSPPIAAGVKRQRVRRAKSWKRFAWVPVIVMCIIFAVFQLVHKRVAPPVPPQVRSDDSVPNSVSLTADSGNSVTNPAPAPADSSDSINPKGVGTQITLRSKPTEGNLTVNVVKSMLRRYNFYCGEYSWSKEYCNPKGTGFQNNYEKQSKNDVAIVVDHASGLVWQQSGSNESRKYEEAKKYVDRLNQDTFAGYHDWRLPTLEEAMSLMEPTKMNGDLYIDPLFDQKQRWIWTSDRYSASSAWVVGFYYGGCYLHYDFDDIIYVRAVR